MNVLLGGLLASVCAIVFRSILVGGVVLLVSLLVIYFRGYLVPGTPGLTERYLPDWLLRRFGKDPHGAAFEHDDPGFDRLDALESLGLVVEDPAGDDVALDPAFERAWYIRMRSVTWEDVSVESLAELLDVDADNIDLTTEGHGIVAWYDGTRIGHWESRAAYLADMTAFKELSSFETGWSDLPLAQRSEVLGALRLFLKQCPVCEGQVKLGEEVVESCCLSYDVVAATCTGCDSRLFEVEYDSSALFEAEQGRSAPEESQ